MSKPISTPCIILKSQKNMENNTTYTLYTRDYGILYATRFGGAKSKLRGLLQTWNGGIIYLREAHEGRYYNIQDFDPRTYHETFREDLYKNFASCLASELIIKTKASGNQTDLWRVFNGFIDGLNKCNNEDDCEMGLIRFLIRFLKLSGLSITSFECDSCGKTFLSSEISTNEVSYIKEKAYLKVSGFTLVCPDCYKSLKDNGEMTDIHLDSNAINYLFTVANIVNDKMGLIPLLKTSRTSLKKLLFYEVQTLTESPLKTIQSGKDIL